MRIFIFIFTAILMLLVFLDVFFVLNLLKQDRAARDKSMCTVLLMSSGIFLFLGDFMAVDSEWSRLLSDIIFISAPFLALSHATFDERDIYKIVSYIFVSVYCLVGLYYFLTALSVLPPVPAVFTSIYSICSIVSLFIIIILSRVLKLMNVRNIMLSSTMDDCLNSDLDNIYYSCLLMYSGIALCTTFVHAGVVNIVVAVTAVLTVLTLTAVSVRLVNHSYFIFATTNENRLLASTSVTPMDLAKEISKDKMFKDIYLRILTLLNKESLYLDADLTIKGLASRIGSNKNYISRAVVMNSGKNFSQFINYYRVSHAVKLMQMDPRQRIGDLYAACGFNSHVTFNMAFKYYMKMSPSEWLETERKSYGKRAPKKVPFRPDK